VSGLLLNEYVLAGIAYVLSFFILNRCSLFVGEIKASDKIGLFRWLLITVIAIASFLASMLYTIQFLGSLKGSVFAGLSAAIALLILSYLIGSTARKELFGSSNSYIKFFKGVFFGLISYPFITITVQLINLVLSYLFGIEQQDQLAYIFLKNLAGSGWFFWAAVVSVAAIVPIGEELLFRGYILAFLCRIFQPGLVAAISGAIFALFHMASSQGFTNISFFIGLTIFGILAANLKTKENSLLATIGMHSSFNTLSLIILINQ